MQVSYEEQLAARLGLHRRGESYFGFGALSKLPKRFFLGLQRTDVEHEGIAEIAQLTTVTSLELIDTAITEKCASDLMQMKQLEYVFLSEKDRHGC